MQQKNANWCFTIKEGIRITEPNERLSTMYLEQATSSLRKAHKDYQDKELLWATVAIYYSEYYALYSFLQRIGITCQNHTCSILIAQQLLGDSYVNTINDHKNKRIDAQYYLHIGKESLVRTMLTEAQQHLTLYTEINTTLTREQQERYQEQVMELAKKNKKLVTRRNNQSR